MRRLAIPLILLGLGAGATALAQDTGDTVREPTVRSRQVFSLPGGCRPGERVTINVDPSGAVLESMRVHVAGLLVVRMTGVAAPATATVQVPTGEPTRVTATADTMGGQELYLTRIYNRCAQLAPVPDRLPVIGGGED
jgi:hypothetical protein